MSAVREKDGRREGRSRLGQVVIEVLLILPVFLTIVFTIMELGNMCFWVIVLNHATYEVARLGSLTAGSNPGSQRQTFPRNVDGQMRGWMAQALKNTIVTSKTEATTFDRQAGMENYDLVVTARYPVHLLFPLSSILLSSHFVCPQGPGFGRCYVTATVRMPVEQPLYK